MLSIIIQFSKNKIIASVTLKVTGLATSYSPGSNEQVPSALEGLTVVFGMGTCVTPLPSSPDIERMLSQN